MPHHIHTKTFFKIDIKIVDCKYYFCKRNSRGLIIIVKRDFHCFFHWSAFWAKITIKFMFFFFNCGTKIHQFLRNALTSLFHYLLQFTCMTFIAWLEKSITYTSFTSSSSSVSKNVKDG